MISVPDTIVDWVLAVSSTIVLGLSSGGFLYLRGKTLENEHSIRDVKDTLHGKIERHTSKVADEAVSVVYCEGVQKLYAQATLNSQAEHKQIADVLKEIKNELKDIRKDMRESSK